MADIKRYATDPLAFFDALTIPSALGVKRFGDCMADFQREWFKAVAPSLLALSRGEVPPIGRFWTERTKGASKDSDVALCLLWLLAFSKVKLDAQVGAADREQAQELQKAASDILRLNEWLSLRPIEQLQWALRCPATGSLVTIIASDVASSHGARPDVVVLNELSHVTKEDFAQNLLDNASKKPRGLVIIATNAGFQSTWQATWRDAFRNSSRWHFHQWSQPAPWLGDDEVEEAQRRNSRSRFNRLYWGEWVSQSGDALDQSDIDACVDSSLAPMGRQQGWSFAGGLDLGVRNDHSALVIVGFRRDSQQLRLAYAESWAPDPRTGQVDLIHVEQTVLATHKRFDPRQIGFDPYAAQLMAQRLQRQRVRMKEIPFVGSHLNEMASTLLEVFRSRRIRLSPCPKLIRDLQRLTIAEKSYGYKLEATRDVHGHADLATALAVALPLCVEGSARPVLRAGAGEAAFDDTPYESDADPALRRLERIYRNLREHEARLGMGPSEAQEGFARAACKQFGRSFLRRLH